MIELRNLTKSYDERSAAVEALELRIETGELVALVGPSGCGKTTTLSMINRLEEPSAGAVLIDGRDTQTGDPVELRRRIGFVFQDIGLFPHMTVGENAGIVLRILGKEKREINGRVHELLTLVGLAPDTYRNRFPAQLSGGERQRVGVARALAASPAIMLMDEPFGAIDPLARDGLVSDYRDIHARLGLTTVIVTHDMTEAILLADRIALMRNGKLVQVGSPRQLFDAPADDFVRAMSQSGGAFAAALADLPEYLGWHVLLSVSAILIGVMVSVPLAIASLRSKPLRGTALATASIVQTIPSLALLALFYPVLLALAGFARTAFGFSFGALGFLPALAALSLYSMLPILRNTIAGIDAVDPAAKRAARGIGMSDGQLLWLVELPLAAPIIIAGIRTAAVWVIGTATLSTPVGQTSLGNYIFAGLQTENWVFVLFGCIAAAALALAIDRLIALAETGVARRSRARLIGSAAGLVIIVTAGLYPLLGSAAARPIVIGSKSFEEQYILAALIEQRLRHAGFPTVRRDGLGSTVIFDALSSGEIDVYVDYTGTVWADDMKRRDLPGRRAVFDQMSRWLVQTRGIHCVGALGFENAYAFAMRRNRADALGIRSLADLSRYAPKLKIGGDYEIFSRPEWRAVKGAYGLGFAVERQYQANFLYRAVVSGDVDVISAFSSDGRIREYDLKVLRDPKAALPPYDAVLLISKARASDAGVVAALEPLVGAIGLQAMQRANLMVDRSTNKLAPDDVARMLDVGISPTRH